MKSWINIVLIGLLMLSCNRDFSSEKQLYQWLNDPENGLVKSRKVHGIEISVKFLPAEYLAYKELKEFGSYSGELKDSVLNSYTGSYVFLLTMGPDEESGQDFIIQNLDIQSYGQYRERTVDLNFNLSEYVSLKTEFGEFKPVLSTMENVYGLSGHRNFYLVFSPSSDQDRLLHADKLDLTFNDELFKTGINHFVFDRDDLMTIPSIMFWKTTI